MMKKIEILFFIFHFHKTPKKRALTNSPKRRRRRRRTPTPTTQNEKKNKKRSFVRHGRRRHPNEEEHLVETETTRWRGRRVRFVRGVKCTLTRTIHFFFRRHFPRLSFFPPQWKERSRVRESWRIFLFFFFCVPKSSSGSPRQIQNRKRLHR